MADDRLLMHDKTAQLRAFAEIFPSELLWEKFPGHRVELPELLARRETYEARFEVLTQFAAMQHLCVSRADLEELTAPLSLPETGAAELLDILIVLAGWQLAAEHQIALGLSYDKVAATLAMIEEAARQLSAGLGDLPRDCEALLNALLPSNPELGPIPRIWDLNAQAYNLSLMLSQLRPSLKREGAGRRADGVLATTMRHLVQSLERLTNERVRTGRGRMDTGPSLKCPLGKVIMKFFKMLGVPQPEATLVRLIHEMRSEAATNN